MVGGKLVRDKIPDIIRARGGAPIVRELVTMDDIERIRLTKRGERGAFALRLFLHNAD